MAPLLLVLWCASCATAPPAAPADYGPYPSAYERLVEDYVQTRSQPSAGVIVTVSSVTEPVRQVWDEIAGWAVWARVRETRPNEAGGVEIKEQDRRLLLRNHKVVLAE